MLREIPFFLVLFISWAWPLFAIMGLISFIDKLTAKPKTPAHVDTPEEAAARRKRSLEMFAQTIKSRLENARTPKDTERAMADLARLQALRLEDAHHH